MSHPDVVMQARRDPAAAEFINPWGMFVGAFVPRWLLARPEVSSGAKLCYAALAFAAGRDGVCSPGQAALAEGLGCSERTVRRYLDELVAHRLIDERREDWGRPLVYRFFAHEWMSGFRHPELVPPLPAPSPDKVGRYGPDRSGRSTNKEEKKIKTAAPPAEPGLFAAVRQPAAPAGVAAAAQAAPGEQDGGG
ncbi:MAG TPA: helix-turn-helix domain-containing protein, partial [Tepidisphaeraceae bacterium]|nr:helix-turn-helix domain-containing protein [Tepidisphaeraceae bacterium]